MLITASGRAALANDGGTFQLTIQDAPIGTDTFTAEPSGSSDGTASVSLGGRQVSLHFVTTATNGRLSHLSADGGAQGGYAVTFTGPQSELMIQGGGQSVTSHQDFPARLFAFSGFAPHLLSPLVAAYDRVRGGSQRFDIVAVDAVRPGGKLAVLSATLSAIGSPESRVIAGKPLRLMHYSLSVPGATGTLEIRLIADDENRLLVWNIPAQKYLAVRQGYEALLHPVKKASADATKHASRLLDAAVRTDPKWQV
jgi:hypothetical protein